MINYFFVNPAAGQGKGIERLITDIKTSAEALNMQYEIYITKATTDGETAARNIAQQLKGKQARFYSCGGDGTLNEILNGAAGFENISVGCIPIGTGNDFVRNFPEAGDFHSIRAQLLAEPRPIDLIRYAGVINGSYQQRYCANMFNIGFDCNVVELAGRLKKKPFIAGPAAYLLAVLGIFLQKKVIRLRVEERGQVLKDGEVLLCAIANGAYCGGGMFTSPQSSVDDGKFDLNLIRDVSRVTFVKLFPKYKAGSHLGLTGIDDILTVKRCTSLMLTPKEKNFFLCVDGEIALAEKIEFTIVPGALSFLLPVKP